MLGFLKWIFGTAQDRLKARYSQMKDQVREVAQGLQDLSKEQLASKTVSFRQRLAAGENLDDLLIEAMAVFTCMCQKLVGSSIEVMGQSMTWELVPYDVQIMGACALHEGGCIEMQTGEGKTLTATMPLYLNALASSSHLVTVNDYLAQRDCEWTGHILRELGITTGFLLSGMTQIERKKVYEADVVYGTASEFGFDYLRDHSLAQSKEQQVQRGHHYVIIDEADSILIDEARTPLIISGPSGESRHLYGEIKDLTASMIKEQRLQSAQWISEAKKVLDELKLTRHEESLALLKFTKAQKEQLEGAIDLLWKVSKSTPRHRMLKKLMENPNIRHLLDERDLFYYSDINKEEREEALSHLYIVVDEKRSDYELTDKGIDLWASYQKDPLVGAQDFLMLNLGDEFLKIDEDGALSEEEKMSARIEMQKEDERRKERTHNLRQLLRAHLLMERDVDYMVHGGKVIIIDEHTGRPQPGRRFSDGLHQAIEAKEGLEIQGETKTCATVTIQNYFRLYKKRSGMSGTCQTEAKEFKEVYGMEVIEIPTHLSCQRSDGIDQLFVTQREKFQAIIDHLQEIHQQGRPILVGTESVDISEKLSRILRARKLEHTVLNAKNHAKEAQIVAQAGQKGAITVSTNMAGRGTDIKLGEGVAALGGLHVLGTSRSESRRIDRQLRGRCARQGDPGTSQFFVCFEDQLFRKRNNRQLNAYLQNHRPDEGEAIVSSMISAVIEEGQKQEEQRSYAVRKHTLEYDNVMDNQRNEIYALRAELLSGERPLELCHDFMEETIELLSEAYLIDPDRGEEQRLDEKRATAFLYHLRTIFPVPQLESKMEEALKNKSYTAGQLIEQLKEHLFASWKGKIDFMKERLAGAIPDERFHHLLSQIILHRLDQMWQIHIERMDQARANVQLRALGQKDPLMEYKDEAFILFEELNFELKKRVSEDLFRFDIVPSRTQPPEQKPVEVSKEIF